MHLVGSPTFVDVGENPGRPDGSVGDDVVFISDASIGDNVEFNSNGCVGDNVESTVILVILSLIM